MFSLENAAVKIERNFFRRSIYQRFQDWSISFMITSKNLMYDFFLVFLYQTEGKGTSKVKYEKLYSDKVLVFVS